MNKRTERVKSIFDSDNDSDDENASTITNPFLKENENDEDEEDNKLRKTIDAVCSSLGNEKDEPVLDKVEASSDSEIKYKDKKCDSSSDSEVEIVTKKDEASPTKFNIIPILEENEYNLLSEFCKETVEKDLEEASDKGAKLEVGLVEENVSENNIVPNELNVKTVEIPLDAEEHSIEKHLEDHEIFFETEQGSSCIIKESHDDTIQSEGAGSIESKAENDSSVSSIDESRVNETIDSDGKFLDHSKDISVDDSYDNINNESLDSSDNVDADKAIDSSCNNTNNDFDSSIDVINNESLNKSVNIDSSADYSVKEPSILEDLNDLSNRNSTLPSHHVNAEECDKATISIPICEIKDFNERMYVSDASTSFEIDVENHDDQSNKMLINKINIMTEDLPEEDLDKSQDRISELSHSPQESEDSKNTNPLSPIKAHSTLISDKNNDFDEKSNEKGFPVSGHEIEENSNSKEIAPLISPIEIANIDKSSCESLKDDFSRDKQLPVDAISNNSDCDKKRKVRVEDVFTDSENEATSKTLTHHSLFSSQGAEADHVAFTEGPVKKIRKKRAKRARATSINLPAIMLAFEKGWIREVVYRSSNNIAPRKADVYYYTPEGKKLRSRIEIEDYLTRNKVSDLTLQNFSFFKEPLGVEECYEKIRHASASVKIPLDNSTEGDTNHVVLDISRKRVRKPAQNGISSAKRPKSQMLIKKVLVNEMAPKALALKGIRNSNGSGTGNFPHISASDSAVYATHLFPCNPPLNYPRIITPLIKGASKDKGFHCTPNCYAGGGNVPNLQCVKCVCLFHPDCCQMPPATVPLILSLQAKFLCPNCYKEETENTEERDFIPAPCYEPLAYDPPSDSEDEGLCSDFEHPSYTYLASRPSTPQTPTVFSKQFNNLHSPNSSQNNISMTPPTISDSANSPTVPNLSIMVPMSNGSSSTSLSHYLCIQTASQGYDLNSVMLNSSSLNSQLNVPRLTNPLSLSTTFMSSNSSAPHMYPRVSPLALEMGKSSTEVSPPAKKRVRTLPPIQPFLRGGEHLMEDMSKGIQILRHIFSYLSVTDLLVVSRVCLLWRDLALGPSYWRAVRLRNVCVKDWDKMVTFLERRGTSLLDLRKMVLRVGTADAYREKMSLFQNISNTSSVHDEEIDIENPPIPVVDNDGILENDPIQQNTSGSLDVKDNRDYVEVVSEEKTEEIGNCKDVEAKASQSELPELVKDSIMEVNSILRKEIEANNQNSSSLQIEGKESLSFSETKDGDKLIESLDKHKNYKKIDSKMQQCKDDEKRIENEQDKIVTSVLSEHDYFGRQVKVEELDSTDSSSSDSEDSESQNEVEAERALDEKLESHKKNIEDGNLKETLQWEHEPQSHIDSHIPKQPNELTAPQKDEDTEFFSKLDYNLEKRNRLKTPLFREWDAISAALSSLRCLQSIVVGPCECTVVELILLHCHQLTGITALNLIASDNENIISFDPSYLMHTKQLQELHLGSKKNFVFKSNFNFIKLPHLKALMLKGLKTAGTGWPYMGIHLTHLHLSCIDTFSHKNWLNIYSMTELVELELDGNGADFDGEICLALTKLIRLKKLALLDWNIGPKLPFTLKKLHNIKYLHVIPAAESQNLRGIYAGRLMVMLDFTKHLEEFVWGIQPPNRVMDEKSGEKIYIQNMKPGKETGVMEGEEVRAIAIDSFKGFIKCRIPQTKVTVRKVAVSNWITGDGWFS